jgi:hypothetical protein
MLTILILMSMITNEKNGLNRIKSDYFDYFGYNYNGCRNKINLTFITNSS